MRGEPGSAGWLLQHELRLFWYGSAPPKAGNAPRRPGNATIAAVAVFWIALHVGAWLLLRKLASEANSAPYLAVFLTVILIACATIMLSVAIRSSVVALYDRGDLDLLLSSPLPSHSIFTVRLAGVVAATAAIYLFLAAPVANAGLLLGQFQWLGLYPAVIGLATVCTCLAMLLTLGLIRVIGARRTRVAAQLFGAAAGALMFILSQVYVRFSQDPENRRAVSESLSGGALSIDSPVWFLGRAALGDPAPVLALIVLSLLGFVLTARFTHGFFVRGLQQAASSPRSTRPRCAALPGRFDRSLFSTVLIKEWRLIARDPHLISQVLLQLIYLLPVCLLVFRDSGLRAPAIGAGLTVLCASLTASLAWIVISAEDAPDLLRVSPASPPRLRAAKLAAATLPPLALVVVPLAWMLVRMPVAGVIVSVTVLAAMTGAGLIVLWCARPSLRSQFRAGGKGSFLVHFLELLNNLSWGIVAWQLVSASQEPISEPALLATVFAGMTGFVTLGVARLLKRP